MQVYFISGLGADKRAFDKLELPLHWNTIHLNWIKVNENETLNDYVIRLSKQIDTTNEFCIVGLSFGGIVAVELSKILKPRKTIIISSISTKYQLPIYFKIIGAISLHKVIPTKLFNRVYPLTDWFFGIKTVEEKVLIRKIIHNTSSIFLKWAIHQIVNWKNIYVPKNLIHIHGTNDHIFPYQNTRPDFLIKNGGHFMVYNKAKEISDILIKMIT